MLRIHFMQQWYALSDPGMEDALYEIESMRRFAGIELNEDAIPDETTKLKFRRSALRIGAFATLRSMMCVLFVRNRQGLRHLSELLFVLAYCRWSAPKNPAKCPDHVALIAKAGFDRDIYIGQACFA